MRRFAMAQGEKEKKAKTTRNGSEGALFVFSF
jgi:hypothetical protein